MLCKKHENAGDMKIWVKEESGQAISREVAS